jgi:CheY-like chemotaxis protein
MVILDIAMPGMDGFQTMKELGRPRPELPVIVLSSSENPKDVRHALPQGALGYVPKSARQHTLLGAVRLVMDGDVLAILAPWKISGSVRLLGTLRLAVRMRSFAGRVARHCDARPICASIRVRPSLQRSRERALPIVSQFGNPTRRSASQEDVYQSVEGLENQPS